MGILGKLQDSARILGDSRGFLGFLEKVYEVSEVSSPSVKMIFFGGLKLVSYCPVIVLSANEGFPMMVPFKLFSNLRSFNN